MEAVTGEALEKSAIENSSVTFKVKVLSGWEITEDDAYTAGEADENGVVEITIANVTANADVQLKVEKVTVAEELTVTVAKGTGYSDGIESISYGENSINMDNNTGAQVMANKGVITISVKPGYIPVLTFKNENNPGGATTSELINETRVTEGLGSDGKNKYTYVVSGLEAGSTLEVDAIAVAKIVSEAETKVTVTFANDAAMSKTLYASAKINIPKDYPVTGAEKKTVTFVLYVADGFTCGDITKGNTFASVEAAEGASADGYTAYTITGTLTDAVEGEKVTTAIEDVVIQIVPEA